MCIVNLLIISFPKMYTYMYVSIRVNSCRDILTLNLTDDKILQTGDATLRVAIYDTWHTTKKDPFLFIFFFSKMHIHIGLSECSPVKGNSAVLSFFSFRSLSTPLRKCIYVKTGSCVSVYIASKAKLFQRFPPTSHCTTLTGRITNQ